MSDLDRRIRALSPKPRHVERLTLDLVVEAMAPREKPPVIPKSDLRAEAEKALATFRGNITKVPAVDRETIARPRWKDRRP